MGDTKQSYTVREVAELLSCSVQHVHNMIEAGRLDAFNIATDTAKRPAWRIRRKALDALLSGSLE